VRSSLGPDVEQVTIEGQLIGVNARTWSFELLDERADRRYSGKTVDRARAQLLGLTSDIDIGHNVERKRSFYPLLGRFTTSTAWWRSRLYIARDPAASDVSGLLGIASP